jgi:hypothetical protein
MGFPTKTLHTFLVSHACHMPSPPHSPWLYLPNDIWGWVQKMKFLTVQLPPFSYYLILLLIKYSPYNPVIFTCLFTKLTIHSVYYTWPN